MEEPESGLGPVFRVVQLLPDSSVPEGDASDASGDHRSYFGNWRAYNGGFEGMIGWRFALARGPPGISNADFMHYPDFHLLDIGTFHGAPKLNTSCQVHHNVPLGRVCLSDLVFRARRPMNIVRH